MASLVYCIPGMTMKSKPSAPTPSARKFLNSCSLCDRNCINLPRPRPNDRLNLSLPSLANGLCTMEPLAPSRPHHRPRDLPDPICSCCRPTIPASFCHGWSSGVCEKGSSTPCISPGTGKELQTLQFIVFYSTKTPPPNKANIAPRHALHIQTYTLSLIGLRTTDAASPQIQSHCRSGFPRLSFHVHDSGGWSGYRGSTARSSWRR